MIRTMAAIIFVVLSLVSVVWAGDGGWYLLVPPQSAYDKTRPFLEGIQVYDGAPLRHWTQVAAYDTAAACETDRGKRTNAVGQQFEASSKSLAEASGEIRFNAQQAYLEELKKNPRLPRPTTWPGDTYDLDLDPRVAHERELVERDHANDMAWLFAARCIKSDDPRLRSMR